ncbi:MAG: hypothetical protein PVH41_17100 [Anaerolineae bacterium]|jgi:hypothetical protein
MLVEPIAVTMMVIDALEALGVRHAMGGCVSDRQWRDVLGVLKVQGGRLDFDAVRRMAASLGVTELLACALEAAAE